MQYPMPTGHLKSIVDMFHNSLWFADSPNMAIGAAVSIVATLACGKYRYGSIWPNLSVVILGSDNSISTSALKERVSFNVLNRLMIFKHYPKVRLGGDVSIPTAEDLKIKLLTDEDLAFKLSSIEDVHSPISIPSALKVETFLSDCLTDLKNNIDSYPNVKEINKDLYTHMKSHFFKLTLIHSISNGAKEISIEDVSWAEKTTYCLMHNVLLSMYGKDQLDSMIEKAKREWQKVPYKRS